MQILYVHSSCKRTWQSKWCIKIKAAFVEDLKCEKANFMFWRSLYLVWLLNFTPEKLTSVDFTYL